MHKQPAAELGGGVGLALTVSGGALISSRDIPRVVHTMGFLMSAVPLMPFEILSQYPPSPTGRVF